MPYMLIHWLKIDVVLQTITHTITHNATKCTHRTEFLKILNIIYHMSILIWDSQITTYTTSYTLKLSVSFTTFRKIEHWVITYLHNKINTNKSDILIFFFSLIKTPFKMILTYCRSLLFCETLFSHGYNDVSIHSQLIIQCLSFLCVRVYLLELNLCEWLLSQNYV